MNGNQAGLGLSAWYTDIPPITRYYLSAVFASTLCIRFGVISPAWLVLHWQSITRNLEVSRFHNRIGHTLVALSKLRKTCPGVTLCNL